MDRPSVAQSILAAQVALGFLVASRLAAGRTRRPALRPVAPAQARISVVVPARDEQERLTPCLTGLLADSDLLEVMVVDDESSDATAQIASELGARVVGVGPRPPGWVGKTWALQTGLRACAGDWVVFVDADVRPRPGLAAALVGELRAHRDDVLSAGLRFRVRTRPDAVLHPALTASLAYRFGVLDAEKRRRAPAQALLNGQCIALPRGRFLAAGGFAPVKGHLVEDVALAQHLSRGGWTLGFVSAGELGEVEMYPSARETLRGWGRSIAVPGTRGRPRTALDLATLALTSTLPQLRLATGRAGRVDAALVAMRFALAAAIAPTYRPRSLWPLLAPLADPLALLACARSALTPARTWRGRTYA